ncbi:MAG: ABC transporter ATP-binding protein [Chloroflexi bacterium]|jgi:branched-chain amino acid transport system ATP-binding protein|nr:ABC transporter ATP-binding protein [Chloroflexota bacterium]
MDEPLLIMEVDQISIAFGGVRALDGVSFNVYERQILALIGPNGAGKTTLLNIVAGTLPAGGGQVRFRGKRLNGRPTHDRVRMGIARTFQQAHIFDQMTVLENVMVGCHLRGQCGLLHTALRLPSLRREEEDVYLDAMRYLNLVGLGTKADQLAGSLPFGQQRLLAMGRALASNPTVLLLDEPAAGLNRLEKNDLADLILRIQQMGITIVLVEHDMELVMRLADWVVVLNHGQRLAQGTPDQVRRDPAVVAAYLGTERD